MKKKKSKKGWVRGVHLLHHTFPLFFTYKFDIGVDMAWTYNIRDQVLAYF
jgi:hypothetical protein